MSSSNARVLYAYDANDGVGSLKLEIGQIVQVLKEDPDGWWTGRVSGQTGIFPGSYVKKIPSTSGRGSPAPPPRRPTPSNAGSGAPAAGSLSGTLPPLIDQTLSWLSHNALSISGLFRESANAVAMRQLKDQFDSGRPVNLAAVCKDPHVIAGLLKIHFRELRDPIIPKSHVPRFSAVSERDTAGLEVQLPLLRVAVATLPSSNRFVLYNVFSLLVQVSKRSAVNMMKPMNLAICWTPSLFRSGATLTDVVALMIEHFDYVFGLSDQLPSSTTGSELVGASGGGSGGLKPLPAVPGGRKPLSEIMAGAGSQPEPRDEDAPRYKPADLLMGNVQSPVISAAQAAVAQAAIDAAQAAIDEAEARLAAVAPSVWDECETDEGAVYYFNSETEESSWDVPDDYVRWQQEVAEAEAAVRAARIAAVSPDAAPAAPIPAPSIAPPVTVPKAGVRGPKAKLQPPPRPGQKPLVPVPGAGGGPPPAQRIAVALFDFAGGQNGDLPFKKGQEIVVLESDKDWWKGQLDGKTGIFPHNYCKPTNFTPGEDSSLTHAERERQRAVAGTFAQTKPKKYTEELWRGDDMFF